MRRTMAAAAVLATIGGCGARYTTPGGPADFRALGVTPQDVRSMTDSSIAEKMERRPLASFPTSIAVVRVQSGGYRSRTAEGWGSGRVTVLTQRDVETESDFERLRSLPGVRGIAMLNRMILPAAINSERDLREAAAAVQADMLLLYTIDTSFSVDNRLPGLSIVTLGALPDNKANVNATASAVLVDTRNGFVYGLAESTDKAWQIANGWTTEVAVDQSRLRAETKAFQSMLKEVEKMWGGVVSAYAPAGSVVVPAAGPATP